MKKIVLSYFFSLAIQSVFATDVLNFYSAGAIVYREDVTKIDSVVFTTINAINSVVVYSGGVQKYSKSTVNIDSMIFSTILTCYFHPTSEIVYKGKTYSTENLNVSTFRNGDSIPEAKTNAEWMAADSAKKPAWCYYNNVDNGYGKLYNFYAVEDPRGLAPIGWSVINYYDWKIIENNDGGELKSNCGWSYSIHANNTNSSGFSAFPAGFRRPNGSFYGSYQNGYFWTGYDQYNSVFYGLLMSYDGIIGSNNNFKLGSGLSVRCVKN